MEKISEWLSNKFQHPLSLVFFLLGGLLILLGVSTGFDIPLLKKLAPDTNYRVACLAIGGVCCLVAIIVYYRPPKNESIRNSASLPDDLKLNFTARRASLSEKQGRLLYLVEYEGHSGDYVSQDTLQEQFNEYSLGELFYRLEQLRLLGFLERQTVGQNKDHTDRYSYSLSTTYRLELGDNPRRSRHRS